MLSRGAKIRNSLTIFLSALPLLGWGLFTLWTRNSFRLGDFSGGHQLAVLALSILPVLWWFGLSALRLPGPDVGAVLFAFAACGWVLVLCSGWGVWNTAFQADSIGPVQLARLRQTGLACGVACLLPMTRFLTISIRKQGKR